MNPRTADTLYSQNAGKLFMPASNQKILTGAVALAQLGPEYRYRTAFMKRGPLLEGALQGDLVVVGNGDPTLSDRVHGDAMAAMAAIADSLAGRGLRSVTGKLASGGNAFPDAIYGYGWELDDLTSSGAPVDELLFDEGMVNVLRRVGLRDSVVETGTSDPTRAYLAALDTALRGRGITVAGGIADSIVTLDAGLDTLYAFSSPPLREILRHFEKPSQNQIGEILIRTLGRERAGVGIADSGAAVISRQLLAWGAEKDGFVVYDGSGLSRHNLVSPETLVRTLVAIQRDTAFSAFYDALPIAATDGTVRTRMAGTAAAGNMHAKTGTLEFVRSLSGYVTTADGERLVFSLLSNHFIVPVDAINRFQDAVVTALANYRSGPSR